MMGQDDKQIKQEAASDDAAFLAFLQVDDAPVPVEGCEGCLIRAIPDAEYQQVRAYGQRAAYDAKGSDEERMAAKTMAERAALLAFGVAAPKKSMKEWLHLLGRAQTTKVELLLGAIRERSGIEDQEAALVKKALEAILPTQKS